MTSGTKIISMSDRRVNLFNAIVLDRLVVGLDDGCRGCERVLDSYVSCHKQAGFKEPVSSYGSASFCCASRR